MRHRKAGYKLGRNPSHRLALFRNLSMALIRHERIITTVEKAKAVKPFVERLITLARDGSLHARRLAISRLGPMADAEVKPDDEGGPADHRTVVQKLFADLGPRFKDRPGGYTRVIKRLERRLGDGGHTAFLELLKEGEVKVRTKAPAPAPAPRLEEEPRDEAPTPESTTSESATAEKTGATGEQASASAENTPENPETKS
jgi:large subunit ribosomal protein L17